MHQTLKQQSSLHDLTYLNPEKVRPVPPRCGSSSGSAPSTHTGLEIARPIAQAESNIAMIPEAMDAYKESSSHRKIVEKMSVILFEYRGALAKLKVPGKHAESRGLTAQENDQATRIRTRMQELITQDNRTIPAR